MPGAGFKTFTAGEVFTATDANTYLMQQAVMVFTNEAARDAAITSPSEGMHAYLTAPTVPAATGASTFIPSGVLTIYNGSVWVCTTEVAAFTGTTGTRALSSMGALTGGGTNPTVTLVTGTTAHVFIGINSYATGGYTGYTSVAVSGASTIASDVGHLEMYYPATDKGNTWQSVFIISGLTAGTNTFTLEYQANGGTVNFRNRRLQVMGIA